MTNSGAGQGQDPPSLAPRPDQVDAIRAAHPDGPIQMINMSKLRESASYPADYRGDADPDCSAQEALQRFSAGILEPLAKRGARIVLMSGVDGVYLGDMDQDEWDQITIVEYPDVESLMDLAADPDVQAAVVHRSAALERLVILATTPVFDASSSNH